MTDDVLDESLDEPLAQEQKSPAKKPRNPHLIPFKKGQSGNPGGRPKGTQSLVPLLRRKLKEQSQYDKQGRKYVDLILEGWLLQSTKSLGHLTLLLRYLEGDPPATVLLGNSDNDNPLRVELEPSDVARRVAALLESDSIPSAASGDSDPEVVP